MKLKSWLKSSGERDAVPVNHGAGDSWYLDADLSATGPTAINLSFLNDAVSVVTNVSWVPLDLLTADDLRIRKNDAVMFNVQPAGQTNGTVNIAITQGATPVTNLTTTLDQPVAHRFDAAGTYTVTGTFSNETLTTSGSITVAVIAGSFPTNPPACLIGTQRTWACPDMPNGITIEADNTVALTFTNGLARITMFDVEKTHHAVARIYEAGPILASTELVPFWAQGNVDAYLWVTEAYADSQLWQNRMIFKNLPDNVDIKISVVTSGVTLDDSTLERWLTKADLDELGQYDIGLIVPKDIDSDGCHRVQLYQDGVYLGEAYFAETGMPGACNSESGVRYSMVIRTDVRESYCEGNDAVITVTFTNTFDTADANEPVTVAWAGFISGSASMNFGDTHEIHIPAEGMKPSGANNIITFTATNSVDDYIDSENPANSLPCETEAEITFDIVKAEIVSGATNCWKVTTNTLSLTSDSYSPSNAYDWSVSPSGLDYTNSGATFTYYPSSTNTIPGTYTVNVWPTGFPDCSNSNTVTIIKVEMDVKPKGVGDYESLPDPIQIAAGGFASPVHQADVVIQVTPPISGIPISLGLLNGVGHERHAQLEAAGLTTVGGGDAIVVETGEGGVIEGVLTSSDSEDICTVYASLSGSDCQESQSVEFNWIWMDAFNAETDWLLDPAEAAEVGLVTNTLRIRHHRAPQPDAPVLPLDQHEIRFFVEKVRYFDDEGEEQVIINTADEPSTSVDEWAVFVESATTDADGVATAYLDIKKIDGLVYLEFVAYDSSVWQEPPAAADQQAEGIASLASFAASSSSSVDMRSQWRSVGNHVVRSFIYPSLVQYPRDYVPVVTPDPNFLSDVSTCGYIMFYYGTNQISSIRDNMTINIYDNNSWRSAVATEAIMSPAENHPGGILYAGNSTYDKFFRVRIAPFTNAKFRVTGSLPAPAPEQTRDYDIRFESVNASLDFSQSDVSPIRTNSPSDTLYNILPLTYSPSGQEANAEFVNIKAGLTHSAQSSWFTTWFSGLEEEGGALDVSSPVGNQPQTYDLESQAEAEGHLTATFMMKHLYRSWKVTVSGTGSYLQQYSESVYSESPVRRGFVEPANFIVADMKIVKPTGATPPIGQLGANANPENTPLFVFDTAADAGKCKVRCEAAPLTALSAESKALVWSLLEWKLPDVGPVGPGSGVTNDNVTTFTYNGMPTHTDQFGNTNITLRFQARTEWAYHQPIQFRYNRTGTSAAAAALGATPPTIGANYADAGNPNWYVYWQQVANQFENTTEDEASGIFGPQSTHMKYNSDEDDGEGHPAHYIPTQLGSTWSDLITMYNGSGSDIYSFVYLLHHENGHRHSKQLSPEKGGFGANLSWSFAADNDIDAINDTWEQPGGGGGELGFEVLNTSESRTVNSNWRSAWDHGWITQTSMQNPPNDPYTNAEGYVPSAGSGLTVRNENHVDEKMVELRKQDWSSTCTSATGE